MAEITEVRTLDDLYAAEKKEVDGAKEISFGIDGRDYEIDLVTENEEKLRDALAPFLAVARIRRAPKLGRTSVRKTGEPRSRSDRNDAKAVREWAQSRNMQISERGRIPGPVQDAYDLAHSQPGQA